MGRKKKKSSSVRIPAKWQMIVMVFSPFKKIVLSAQPCQESDLWWRVTSQCIRHIRRERAFPGRVHVYTRTSVRVSPQPEQNPLDHSRALWHPAIVTFAHYLAVMHSVQLMSGTDWVRRTCLSVCLCVCSLDHCCAALIHLLTIAPPAVPCGSLQWELR